MRKLLPVVVVAAGLAGCASLSDRPDFQGFKPMPEVARSQADAPAIKAELNRSAALANAYLQAGRELMEETRLSGGGLLGFGLYGAAVAVFNPAPKNLLAAALGGGTMQAWRTALRPSERAKVYIQGYRALDCLHGAAGGLAEDAVESAQTATQVRAGVGRAFGSADLLKLSLESAGAPPPNKAELLIRIATARKALEALDVALKLEQKAPSEAPYRIADVRRLIESNLDRRLSGLAPDYQAALKLISEAAKPPTPSPASGGNAAGGPGVAAAAAAALTFDAQVLDLEGEVADLARRAPTLAADSYENMGRCVGISA